MTADTSIALKPAKRTDIWVEAFDGTYRLFLDIPLLCELERKTGFVDKEGNQRPGSIFQVYDRVAKGRYQLDGQQVGFPSEGAATLDDCMETVRLGLVGGANGVVAGEKVAVSPRRALELVNTYLAVAALEESWTLAFLLLSAVISGREEEPHEAGHSSRTAVFPVSEKADAPEDERDNGDEIGADDADEDQG